MNCDFTNSKRTCPKCGYRAGGHDWRRNCPAFTGPPRVLVGLKLAALLAEFGHAKNCTTCDDMIVRMNNWGPAGCREHRAEIVEHLVKQSKAKSTDLPFGLDLRELLEILVEEAIRLTEGTG